MNELNDKPNKAEEKINELKNRSKEIIHSQQVEIEGPQFKARLDQKIL